MVSRIVLLIELYVIETSDWSFGRKWGFEKKEVVGVIKFHWIDSSQCSEMIFYGQGNILREYGGKCTQENIRERKDGVQWSFELGKVALLLIRETTTDWQGETRHWN